MADFNVVLDTGDYKNGIVNTVIEIPQGSILKIEYRRKLAIFEIDRVEPSLFPKPASYGFIPKTLDEDGDELDTLVIAPEPIPTGVFLSVRVIGVLNFTDDGEADHKIIAVPADDRDNGERIQSIDDLGERWKQQVEFHFTHYKDLKKPGTTKVEGWGDIEDAKKIIEESIERFKTEA
jgi:inorganic pyrophosphatase